MMIQPIVHSVTALGSIVATVLVPLIALIFHTHIYCNLLDIRTHYDEITYATEINLIWQNQSFQ